MNNLWNSSAVGKTDSQKTKRQEGGLNVLKLLATIAIVLAHYQQTSGVIYEKGINFFNGEFFWGYMVELFFVLSGYFTYNYSRSIDSKDSFFSFWWKKYMQFLPLLFITGIATIAVLLWMRVNCGTQFTYSLWACLGGMFGFGRWITTDIIINNPTWYVNVLLLCYAVFYYATFRAKKNNCRPAYTYLFVVCIGVLMNEISNKYKVNVPFFSTYIARGLFCFFFGLLLRELLDTFTPHKKSAWIGFSALYVFGFVYLYMTNKVLLSDHLQYLLSFTVFPTVIILFKMKILEKLFSAKVFMQLSSVTYHTFMWHTPLRYLYINILRLSNVEFKTKLAMYLCLACSFAVGVASFAVENAIKKKRK